MHNQFPIRLALIPLGLIRQEMGLPVKSSESIMNQKTITKIEKDLSPGLTGHYPKALSGDQRLMSPRIHVQVRRRFPSSSPFTARPAPQKDSYYFTASSREISRYKDTKFTENSNDT